MSINSSGWHGGLVGNNARKTRNKRRKPEQETRMYSGHGTGRVGSTVSSTRQSEGWLRWLTAKALRDIEGLRHLIFWTAISSCNVIKIISFVQWARGALWSPAGAFVSMLPVFQDVLTSRIFFKGDRCVWRRERWIERGRKRRELRRRQDERGKGEEEGAGTKFIRRSDFSCSQNKKLMRNAAVGWGALARLFSRCRRESNELRRARNRLLISKLTEAAALTTFPARRVLFPICRRVL